MIHREDIDRIPTAVRVGIVEHFTKLMQRSDREASEAAVAYVHTAKDEQRARALSAIAEVNAYRHIIDIFK